MSARNLKIWPLIKREIEPKACTARIYMQNCLSMQPEYVKGLAGTVARQALKGLTGTETVTHVHRGPLATRTSAIEQKGNKKRSRPT